MTTYRHGPFYIVVIVSTVIVYAVTLAINGLAGGAGVKLGLFLHGTGAVSDYFPLEITPAGWTFSVWGFIYTWQCLWLLYGVVAIFRKSFQGYLYSIMPPIVYIVFMLNNCTIIAWLFLWDRLYIVWALVFIALGPFLLYIALYFSYRAFERNVDVLYKEGKKWDVWLLRLLPQNGLAFFATWTTIATLLNFAMVLHYKLDVALDTSCSVALAILLVEVLVYFSLESTILDKHIRYQFSPYIILNLALAGIQAKNWNPDKTNSIFTAVLQGIVGLLTILKIVIVIIRHRNNPLHCTVKPEIDMAI